MSKEAKLLLLLVTYPIVCLLPYFVGALNDPATKIAGFPLTIVYPIVAMIVYSGILYWASETVWRTPSDKE